MLSFEFFAILRVVYVKTSGKWYAMVRPFESLVWEGFQSDDPGMKGIGFVLSFKFHAQCPFFYHPNVMSTSPNKDTT